MPFSPQQLSDLEDIRAIKHRYFLAIDTADVQTMGEILADDVTIDFRGGNYRVQLKGAREMMTFIANTSHSDAVAMHQGHMPVIRFTGEDTAEGTWYLEDIFISLEARTHTSGSAVYRDRYVRTTDGWKIQHSEYDRIMELVQPLSDAVRITCHRLGEKGLRPADRQDISQYLVWDEA